jgi:serine/threonine-protein phosphatase 2B catalytic subunit
MFRHCNDVDEKPSEEDSGKLGARKGEIIGKIQSLGRMMRLFRTLREEEESIVMLKGFCDGSVKRGLLLGGPDAIKSALGEFQHNMELDKPNLRRYVFFCECFS